MAWFYLLIDNPFKRHLVLIKSLPDNLLCPFWFLNCIFDKFILLVSIINNWVYFQIKLISNVLNLFLNWITYCWLVTSFFTVRIWWLLFLKTEIFSWTFKAIFYSVVFWKWKIIPFHIKFLAKFCFSFWNLCYFWIWF